MDIKKDMACMENVDDFAYIAYSNDVYADKVDKALDKLGYILADNEDEVIDIAKDRLDKKDIAGAISILLGYKDKYEYVLVDNSTNDYYHILNYDSGNFKNALENIIKNL